MYIILSISSKNTNSLTNFLRLFYNLKRKKLFNTAFYAKQSQKKNNFSFISVLQSPHVNKKSQEQFHYNVYNKQLKIRISQTNKFLFVWKIIKRKLFFDLKIKIDFYFENSLRTTLTVKTTDQEKFLPTVFFKKLTYQLKINNQNFSKKSKKKKLYPYYLIKQTFLKLTDINGEKLLKTHF